MINIEIPLFLPIQSVSSININLPIRNLLVPINQSFSGYLIYFYFIFFKRAKNAHIYVYFRLHSQKVIIVEEKQDGVDIDDIGNLKDLLRVVFINEEYGNLKRVIDGGELARNISQRS